MSKTPDELRDEARFCREDADRHERQMRALDWCLSHGGAAPSREKQLRYYAAHLDTEAAKPNLVEAFAAMRKAAHGALDGVDADAPLSEDQWQLGDRAWATSPGIGGQIVYLGKTGRVVIHDEAGVEHMALLSDLRHHDRPPLEPGTVVRLNATGTVDAIAERHEDDTYSIRQYAQRFVRDEFTVIALPRKGCAE